MTLKIANQLLIQEAESRGWDTTVLDEDSQIIMVTPPNEKPIVLRYSITELSSAIGVRVANSKAASSRYLRQLGYPIPATEVYENLDKARSFLETYKKIIVKPSSLSQGTGITTGITEPAVLEDAVHNALAMDSTVLLQQHVEGIEHRFLVIGGECVAVLRREPASVVGDGASTIRELIIKENEKPDRRLSGMTAKKLIDFEGAKRFLGKEITQVPREGEVVYVIDTSNISRGGSSTDMTDEAHISQKRLAAAVAKELGLGVAGVDIMSLDIAKPLDESHSCILEVEENPGLRIHHFPAQGKPRNVAGALLDAIIKNRQQNT